MERNWMTERLRGLAARLRVAPAEASDRARGDGSKGAGGGAGCTSPRLRDGGPRAAVLRLRMAGRGAPRLREELAQGSTDKLCWWACSWLSPSSPSSRFATR